MRQSLPTHFYPVSSASNIDVHLDNALRYRHRTSISKLAENFIQDSISLTGKNPNLTFFPNVPRQFYRPRAEHFLLSPGGLELKIGRRNAITGRPKLAYFTTTRCIKLVQRPGVATPTCPRFYLRSVSFRGRRLARYWISILIVNRGMPSSAILPWLKIGRSTFMEYVLRSYNARTTHREYVNPCLRMWSFSRRRCSHWHALLDYL